MSIDLLERKVEALDEIHSRAFEQSFIYAASRAEGVSPDTLRFKALARIMQNNRERFPDMPSLKFLKVQHIMSCATWCLQEGADGYLNVLPYTHHDVVYRF
jgi:hypothetical protein